MEILKGASFISTNFAKKHEGIEAEFYLPDEGLVVTGSGNFTFTRKN